MKKLFAWLDERTGLGPALARVGDEELRGGARWAYALGSALVALLLVECVTGMLLALVFAPSVGSAWSSVWFIEHRVTLGWFLRGVHANASQAIVVVLGLHLLQVVVYGAYKKPREATWWVGLALFGLVQALVLTGSRMTWDQRTYWALMVELNIAESVPVVGQSLGELVRGGAEVGQQTLTRLYGLHVAVLPALTMLLVVGHRLLVRKHGRTPPGGADLAKVDKLWPAQIARDMAFAVVVIGIVAVMTTMSHGVGLDAPADPARDYPARPEWYLLFLYAGRELLPGSLEILATVVAPGLAGAALFLLPLADRKPSNRVRERLLFVVPIVLGVAGVGGLTAYGMNADAHDVEHQAALHKAATHAARSLALAERGIPPGGPLEMLRNDPFTQGRVVFEQQCMPCHVLGDEGEREAPEQTGWASRAWIKAFLLAPDSMRHYGPIKHEAERHHRDTNLDDMPAMGRRLGANIDAVVEFMYSQGHERQDPPFDAALAERGERIFRSKCTECHVYRGEGNDMGNPSPNLTGWASRTWIRRQIVEPDAEHQFGDANEMPSFGEDLSAHDLDMVTAFLRQERFHTPPTGEPPPRRERRAH